MKLYILHFDFPSITISVLHRFTTSLIFLVGIFPAVGKYTALCLCEFIISEYDVRKQYKVIIISKILVPVSSHKHRERGTVRIAH